MVLADVRTETERTLVREWVRERHGAADVVEAESTALPRRLAEVGGDTEVLPVRVTWLPEERGGERRVQLTDLITLTNPRRPWSRLQPRIARRAPDRVLVVAGQSAPAAELRRRFAEQSGGGEQALARFVRHQAMLACDRAERAHTGDRYKVPRLIAEQILGSARFSAQIDGLAAELGRPRAAVLADARTCLREVATVQSALAIDLFRAVVRPMHASAWTVRVEPHGVRRLKELNRRHALIFLPTHRSYVDPLVLAEVLHQHDLPRNHLLGGDNMSFWPLGPLGRRAGVIFIRRSFGADRVYKLAIREFLGHLVAKRFNLEWYIEGGRTRTGKLHPPKLGLLHYVVAALEDGRADDVLLVPTSIVYDRLQEAGAVTAEQTGAVKRREGLRWMLDYIVAQRRNVGAARVHFGEPFSLRATLQETGHGTARLEKVAFRICDGINRVTPVTSTSMVTLALLGSRDRALTLDQVGRLCSPLLDYLERRGVPGPIAELRRPSGLRAGLDSLVNAGAATRYDGGSEPVWSIAADGHHVAAFYRNGALHHYVNRAIAELALVRLSEHSDGAHPWSTAWRDALATRDLLKFEFFFAGKRAFRRDLCEELELLWPDWRSQTPSPESVARRLLDAEMVVAHRALRSFLDAQWIVAAQLAARDPREAVDGDELVARCLGVGRQHVLQGRVHGGESVSRELFDAALRLAANRDLLGPGGADIRRGRLAWLSQVEEVVARLRTLDELESVTRRTVLDGLG
jgi:glycerol-3-phosphate O-acyltransferase